MTDMERIRGTINLIGAGEYSPVLKTIGGVPQITWQPSGLQISAPQYTLSTSASPFPRLASKYNITEEQARGLQKMAEGVRSPTFQAGVEAVSTPPSSMVRNVQAGLEDVGARIKSAVEKKVAASPPATYSLVSEDITPAWLRTSDIETPRKKAEAQIQQLNVQEQKRLESMQNYVSSMQQLIEQLTSPGTVKAVSQAMVADFAVDALKEATAGTGVDISNFVRSATQAVTETREYLNSVSRTLRSILDLEVDFNQLMMATGMWRNVGGFGSAVEGGV